MARNCPGTSSALLGIGEPAIRRRIREKKLFALKSPGDGEYRIPLWALDPEVSGATAELHAAASRIDEWQLHHFLATPNGSLNGLRPFECLMSGARLPVARGALRGELLHEFSLELGVSLLPMVLRLLRAEHEEALPA